MDELRWKIEVLMWTILLLSLEEEAKQATQELEGFGEAVEEALYGGLREQVNELELFE